jgi:hypothetical protein
MISQKPSDLKQETHASTICASVQIRNSVAFLEKEFYDTSILCMPEGGGCMGVVLSRCVQPIEE